MSLEEEAPTALSGLLPAGIKLLPEVDSGSCELLGPTALVVQAIMGVLVVLSLVYKRHREATPRPWRIWLFDVSKQVVGQMFVHGVNVFISDLFGTHTSTNACVFYFLNILVDTTLGIGIIYLCLRVSTHLFSERLQLKGFQSGQYGTPPSFNFWIRQAAVYVAALTTMKIVVVALFALFPGLFVIGEWLLSWTGKDDTVQVVFTMGLFPIIMNILQFWLIDSIVKASAAVALIGEEDEGDDATREPLFNAESDDDDEDGTADPRRHDVENPAPPQKRSRSNSLPQTEDSKSSTSTLVPEHKGTSTPGSSRAFASHAYPPPTTAPTSPTSASSSSSTKSKRRSPPAPLPLKHNWAPAVNSPDIKSSSRIPSHGSTKSKLSAVPVQKESKDAWAESWGDDDDDWAGRVGEEDWTGRRIEEKKAALGMSAMHNAPAAVSVW